MDKKALIVTIGENGNRGNIFGSYLGRIYEDVKCTFFMTK